MALIGNTEPRIWTPPLRELTPETSLGFAMIAFAEILGIPLLPWQKWLAIHMLELLPNGNFRFRTVVLLVARQNGKSTFAQVLGLFMLYVRKVPLILSTAQNLDIAEEVWAGAIEMAHSDPELDGLIARVVQQRGSKALELTTGARWKVQAATRRGGRGLSGDLVFLDELREHQNWEAWSAISKTTMARDNAIVFALSNAGDITSVVLTHLRKMAHKVIGDPDGLWIDPATGESIVEEVDVDEDALPDDDSLGIFEWSAKPGRSIRDREGWCEANPSLGYTITERAIIAAIGTDTEQKFRMEVLCQWFDGAETGPFPAGAWQAGQDEESRLDPTGKVVYGVDTAWDRSLTRIAVAGYRADGSIHVEVIAERAGTDWVIPWLTSPDRKYKPAGVVWQKAGAPISSITDDLLKSELPLMEWAGTDLGRASGQLYDLVTATDIQTGKYAPKLFHRPQPLLDIAANTASIKPSGDSWMWDRSKSPADISGLVAATAAIWGLVNRDVTPAVSAYESADLLIL
jgi:hypothetical protein